MLCSADPFQSSSDFSLHSQAAGRHVVRLTLIFHNAALHRSEKPRPDLASLFTDPSVAPDPRSVHGLQCCQQIDTALCIPHDNLTPFLGVVLHRCPRFPLFNMLPSPLPSSQSSRCWVSRAILNMALTRASLCLSSMLGKTRTS